MANYCNDCKHITMLGSCRAHTRRDYVTGELVLLAVEEARGEREECEKWEAHISALRSLAMSLLEIFRD